MAYIPAPIEHDLFLSYAHEDAAWVCALQEQLTERLVNRLGCASDVWQDVNKLRTGQKWTEELDRAIRSSAALITVVSRSYQSSDWCGRELDAFLDQAKTKDSLETGGYLRILKVIKFPWLNNAHQGFLSEYQHIPFFDRDAKTGLEREFKPASETFRKAVDKLSFHIEKLFEAMLCGMEKVFVARTSADASDERDAVIREIKAAGYALSPPHPEPSPADSTARPSCNTSPTPASPSTCSAPAPIPPFANRSTSPSRPKRRPSSISRAATKPPPAIKNS